ncbi:MAG: hypothetical protein AB7S70_15705 [Hyphomicrobium sp.]|uniref:hypothetical protein n=1 Tax=Hyphomicrobium sp. TaxID=82 RepID=UPI003D0FFF1D
MDRNLAIAVILGLTGGIPGLIFTYDYFRQRPLPVIAAPVLSPATPAPPAKPEKKQVEDVAVSDREPSFLSSPWKWLEWNQRQNQAKCDPYDPDKKFWCGPPY